MTRTIKAHCVIGGQLVVILDDDAVLTLGRKDDLPSGALEWQRVPNIPGTEAAFAAPPADTADALLMAAIEAGVNACFRLVEDGIPSEAWSVDYAGIVRRLRENPPIEAAPATEEAPCPSV